jgi:hypothetical protein
MINKEEKANNVWIVEIVQTEKKKKKHTRNPPKEKAFASLVPGFNMDENSREQNSKYLHIQWLQHSMTGAEPFAPIVLKEPAQCVRRPALFA